MSRPESKTKIICTLGPASSSEPLLRRMIAAGMDVARLNFSHASNKEHKAKIDLIKKINRERGKISRSGGTLPRQRGKEIKILQDLEGYRIRIGKLKGGKPIEVKKRQTVILTNRDVVGEKDLISFDYRGPLKDIKGAEFIYIDDGNIALRVKRIFK